VAPVAGSTLTRRPTSGTLAEVVDLILDKGLVIDAYVRVSLIGIELLTVDVRVVVASVDTYLHFAEATNRLDLRATAEEHEMDLPELMGSLSGQDAARDYTKGALTGAGQAVKERATGQG
jgi:gas vesicle structural protein